VKSHPSYVERLLNKLWQCGENTRQLARQAYYENNDVCIEMQPRLGWHQCKVGCDRSHLDTRFMTPRAEVGHFVQRLCLRIFVDNTLSLARFRIPHSVPPYDDMLRINLWRLLLEPVDTQPESNLHPNVVKALNSWNSMPERGCLTQWAVEIYKLAAFDCYSAVLGG
jgi:hypothetical protein